MVITTLIVLIIVSFFSFILGIRPTLKTNIFFLFFGITLVLLAGFRNGDKMPDYLTYVGMYHQIISGNFVYFIEISFIYLSFFSNYIVKGEPIFLFLIYAALGVTLKLYSIRKLSKLWFFSLVIYICNYFILHEMIQIRAGVASGFILLSILPLNERKFKVFLLFITLATLFHYSSIIFFLLWFLTSKPFKIGYYFFFIILAFIIHYARIDPISIMMKFIPEEFFSVKMDYIDKDRANDLAINVFGIFPITRILILFYFLFYEKTIKKYNRYFTIILKYYFLGVFSYISLAYYPEIAVRIGYTLMTSEIIIIPALVYTINSKFTSRILIVIYAFLAFFFNVFFTTYFNWE